MSQEEHSQFDHENTESSRLPKQLEKLPILKYATEIKEKIRGNDVIVVVGETGSGKTTEIPFMLQEAVGKDDKIAVTQPRRVAARSVARYVAGNARVKVGEEIGYHVRFDDQTSDGTSITFMTDGILLRKMQIDPLLSEYSAIMVDEAHERSLNIDFTLGLLKRLQKKRTEQGRSPLKVLVSSATLEKEKFAKYLSGAPVVEVEGRQYPVELHYEKSTPLNYIKAVAEKVKDIVEESNEGGILVFMPGQQEIEETIEQIEQYGLTDTEILPLYGAMSPEAQDKIFQELGKRKIVVSTNVAETSVTVPGIKHVVDSGLIKQMEFDPQTGIRSLVTTPHAKSGCVQRTGRAGRLSEGDCYRLYDKGDFKDRQDFQTPEIKRTNLANVVLTMKRMGIEDVASFEFIDPPDPEAIEQAIETLKTLGALDESESVTEIGEVMADLPLEPHIGRMIIEAEKHGCVETVCTLAAFMSTRSVFVRPKEKQIEADRTHLRFKVSGSDFLTLWKVWQEYEASNYDRSWAHKNFLHTKALEEVRNVRFQLFSALKKNGIRVTENNDPEAIGKSVASGLIENLMERTGRFSYRRIKDYEQGFFIHPSSSTFGSSPPLFVPGEIVETTKRYARTIQTIKPEWLKEIAPHLVRENVGHTYYDYVTDSAKQLVTTNLVGSFGSLHQEEREATGNDAVEAFASFLASHGSYPAGGEQFLFMSRNVDVISQLNDLWIRSEGSFMDERFSTEHLRDWYLKQLGDIHSLRSLEKAIEEGKPNMKLNISEFLSAKERERILSQNPDIIEIDGKEYKVSYEYDRYDGEFESSIDLEGEEILQLEQLPKLPSGRLVGIKGILVNGERRSLRAGSTELKELKKSARSLLALKKERRTVGRRKALFDDFFGRRVPRRERKLSRAEQKTELPQRMQRFDLRIDDYWELANQGDEGLGKIVSNEKSKDIGRWRLAVAALASKGQEGTEVLIESGVNEIEELDAVEKGLKKAVTEAGTNERIDLYKITSSVDDSIKMIGIYKRLAVADSHKLVKDFLGDDKQARKRFRKLFYELMQGREKLPDLKMLGPDINRILEDMTG